MSDELSNPHKGLETSSSIAIVEAVAKKEGKSPMDLTPLAESIDTDALNSVLQGKSSVSVDFSYEGYNITIDTDGRISLCE